MTSDTAHTRQNFLSGSIGEYEEKLPSHHKLFPLHFDITIGYEKWLPSTRRIHKVSRPLRVQEQRSHLSVYEPIMVSLGPYHHGKIEFREVDEFKHLCLHWFSGGDNECKSHLYNTILGMTDRVRSCYADVSIVKQYDDNKLALMMLLDGCFIINFMSLRVSDGIAKDSYNCLGVAGALPFAARDIVLLENQIPFFVLKLLLSETLGAQQAQFAIEDFLSRLMSMQSERAVIPRENEDPPIHILEALRRLLVEKHATTHPDQQYHESRNHPVQKNNRILADHWLSSATPEPDELKDKTRNYASKENSGCLMSCPSVMYLKSKGIRVRPSSSHYLKDIKFESHALYGQLQLPVCYVSNLTLVFLSNMIAYEVAPDNTFISPDLTVLSYINFMKALIQTPDDVTELQQRGLLVINRFANQEQVVQLFKSIDTFNLHDAALYQDVMVRVGEHCNNKAKTWMADLIYGKLNSPWTIIALLSATMLLILTFLQTYFTTQPPSRLANK